MAKTLPDEIPVTRRVHQGALKMILRQASIIAEHRVEVLDDIAERLSADHNIELTGAIIDKDYIYDPNDKTLRRFDMPAQRYALELAEWIVLEQAQMMSDRADDRVAILYDEVAARLSADHNIELTGEELRRDFQTDKDAKGKPNGLMVKRTRATKLPDGNAKGKP